MNNKYAGFWIRFLANLIDGIIIGVINLVLSYIIPKNPMIYIDPLNHLFQIMVIDQIPVVVVVWLYSALLESSEKQGTIGKMALGLIVTDINGNRLSFGRATGRHFAKILSSIPIFMGFFMIAYTEKKQGFHDTLAKTLVLKK